MKEAEKIKEELEEKNYKTKLKEAALRDDAKHEGIFIVLGIDKAA